MTSIPKFSKDQKYDRLHPGRAAKWAKRHPVCGIFKMILQRCNNPNATGFGRYGGRGIECRFGSYKDIVAAIGPRPKGRTVDRINNDGHYEASNIRWATRKQQQNNRRKQNAT